MDENTGALKFRKRPVVIDAIQWDGTRQTGDRLRVWSDHRVRHHGGTVCFIETLEGSMEAKSGDWIIKGVVGEFYPCKPDIFAQIYEAATGDIVGDLLDLNSDMAKRFFAMHDVLLMALTLAHQGNHDGTNEACPTCHVVKAAREIGVVFDAETGAPIG